uniref:Uncharacterized protein n=1 Tax=Clytia hemisphaerica TaxID=252671 RepID=A0A7M5WQE6_9CNID|eukprot:TCONS_00055048-protein
MSATKNFFDREDSPHGLSKRVVLYRYLQQKFAIALNTGEPSTGYDFTYFDAFCGTGKYRTPQQPEKTVKDPLKAIISKQINFEVEPEPCFFDPKNASGKRKSTTKLKAGGKKKKVEQEEETKQPPFPLEYGSPLVSLEALIKTFKERYNKSWQFKRFLYVFEDKQEDYIEKLKRNVRQYLLSADLETKWLEEKQDFWQINIEHSHRKSKNDETIVTVKAQINILFIVGQFQEFEPDQELFEGSKVRLTTCKPMVTFLDPFGYSDTQMDKVIEYLGKRRDVLLFFGVENINRFYREPKFEQRFAELMGDKNWKSYLPEEYKSLQPADKMKALVDVYGKCLRLKHPEDPLLRTCHISMRRGSSQGVDRGCIYDLIGFCFGLKSLSQMKYAMGVGSQNSPKEFGNELYFSDYHYDVNGKWSPLNSRVAEADIIHQYWAGKTCTFGELKQWILTDTSLQIHSRPLQDLEIAGKLEVLDTTYDYKDGGFYGFVEKREDKRGSERTKKGTMRRRKFPPDVGQLSTDIDGKWNTFRNAWQLRFIQLEI